jgi:hypothetical protein
MPRTVSHSYYVVMIDHGRLGLEAVVQPEITRNEVISRIKSHEYQNIAFIHHVDGMLVEDVTGELIDAAEAELKAEHREPELSDADYQAWRWDHERDHHKNLVVL